MTSEDIGRSSLALISGYRTKSVAKRNDYIVTCQAALRSLD
jgi:hypothetical protein